MRDRTFSVKASLRTVVGAYDIAAQYGIGIAGRNPEDVLSIILEAIIKAMERETRIPQYEGEREMQMVLAQYMAKQDQGEPKEISHDTNESSAEPSVEDSEQALIAAAIAQVDDKKLDPLMIPGVTGEVIDPSEGSKEESAPEESVISWDKVPLLDPIRIWAEKTETDSAKEAVLLVYGQIPEELWGTPRAREMVVKAEKAIKSYSQPTIKTQSQEA